MCTPRFVPLLFLVLAAACGRPASTRTSDSTFGGVQARGQHVMGVDQYSSTHIFDDLPDGGRISLQRDPLDTAGVGTIRRHFGEIAAQFRAGDFSNPAFVHDQPVPGTDVMQTLAGEINYQVETLAGGGALRLATSDSAARKAIQKFLAFQRADHRAAGAHAHQPDR